MNKPISRILLLVLCLAMLCSSVVMLASCKDEGKQPENPVDSTPVGDDFPDLPDKKYGGDFILLGGGALDYYIEDASSGDIVDYAMYIRDSAVEDMYGIKIKPVELFYAKVPEQVSTLIKAGDTKSVDIVVNQNVYSSNIVLAGNAKDWYTVPYIDLTADYWPATNIEDLTLNGRNYMLIADYSLCSITSTTCMYFNKELVNTYQMGDIYAKVDAEEWTYFEMLRLVTGVYKDLNENQQEDSADLYGLLTGPYTRNTIWIWAFDNPVFSKNETTGELECTYYSKKIDGIAKNLVQLFRRTDGVRYDDSRFPNEDFVNGRGVFTTGDVGMMTKELRDMKGWGIIPLPKYNDKQDGYKINIGACRALIVPNISTDEEKLERIGVVVTTLEYKSNRDVRPVFYEKALKAKYADEPTEAKMLDLIMDSRMLDFGYIYMGFEGPSFTLQSMLSANQSDVASSWNQNKPKYSKKIEEAYAAFGLVFGGLE